MSLTQRQPIDARERGEEIVDRFFGAGSWRDAIVNRADVAATWLDRQRREARRTGDPRLEALVARAEPLIGPLPRRISTEDLPVICSQIRARAKCSSYSQLSSCLTPSAT